MAKGHFLGRGNKLTNGRPRSSSLARVTRNDVAWPELYKRNIRFGDHEFALGLTERLAAITSLVSSLEQLTIRGNRQFGGLNDWSQLRDSVPPHLNFVKSLGDRIYRGYGVEILHVVRISASMVTLFPTRNRTVRAVAGAVNVGAALALAPVHNNGGDGSDQASFATQAVTTIARASNSTAVKHAALWSIASQAVLAYQTSGWVKLLGDAWRSNEALVGVMRTRTYGARTVWRLLDRYPMLSRAGEVGTLVIECAYPVVFALSPRYRNGYIAGIAGLHLAIAAAMGLGRFVPAFLSLQPAVLYTATQLHSGRRVDSGFFLPAFAVVVSGTSVAAIALRLKDDRLSRRPGVGQEVVEVPSGLRLAVRFLDHPDPAAPLLVFENSLIATQEYWDPVISHLKDRFAILTYNRPGYGASSDQTSTPLASYTSDLNALIGRFRAARPVWGVGHSLGGYLLWSHRAELDAAMRGFVLLDPTVNSASSDSARLAERGEPITRSLKLVATSLRSGWGMFLNPDIWKIAALADDQPAALPSIYRNDRIWRAGIAEWQISLNDLDSVTGTQPASVDHEVVVVSAVGVKMTEDTNADSHRTLAETAGGRHLSLRSSHDGLLVHPRPSSAVAEIVAQAASQEILR